MGANFKAAVRFHRGDDRTIRITVEEADGSRMDLTGADMQLEVRAEKDELQESPVPTALLTKKVNETLDVDAGQILDQLVSTTRGQADFFINSADTRERDTVVPPWPAPVNLGLESDKPPVTYFLAVQLRTAAAKFHTMIDGELRLVAEAMIPGWAAK